jgi:hypothetical protein
VSGFGCQEVAVLCSETLYETKLKANRRTAEPQNIEYRMSKGGIATLGLFYKIDRIPSFDIRYSVFDIRFFLFLG